MSNIEELDLNGKTAIVAVEEVEACDYMETIIKEGGLTVIKANDGQVAFDLIKSRKPNVAVLDVGLPTVFGFDICGMVKKDEELKDVKIILMASVYDSAAYKRGPSSLYGADDYIERHHVKADLVDKIRGVLSGEHYTNEKKEEEEFVPFGGDTESSEKPIELDSNESSLPPLGSSLSDTGGEEDATETQPTESLSSSDEIDSGAIPPIGSPAQGGLALNDDDEESEDFSEEGETTTTTDSSLELGGHDSSDGDFSEEGETETPIPSLNETNVAESAEEPKEVEEPVATTEVETPAPVKKAPYTIDEEKLGINSHKILASDDQAEAKAKKLARVVVSDIFLYNSEHVDVGIREGTFYKLIREDLRDGIKYMKKKIPKHLPSDQILKDAFDEYILKRKEMMDKE